MSRKRNWLVRIDHMIQVIQELENITVGIKDLDVFIANPHMYRTAERILEILGEAAKYIPEINNILLKIKQKYGEAGT